MAQRTLDQLYALSIPEIRDIFLNIVQDVVDSAILTEMIKAIESNDVEALYRATGFTPAVLGSLLDKIEDIYQTSATITSDGWPTPIRTPTGLVNFHFSMRNPVVEQDIKNYSSTLVSEITNETRAIVRKTLQDGIIRGQNPRTTALSLVGRIDPGSKKRMGGSIGLTESQNEWVLTTRRRLEQLDKNYFNSKLRDKRFDKMVKDAIEKGKPLSKETIEKIMVSYKNKVLKYRADMIARTESLHSINRGERAAYMQAIEEEKISRSAIKKEWDAVGDLRTRRSHVIMGLKYGKGKGIDFDEPFVSPSGSRLMQPGDTSLGASAKEIVHCRCSTRYRVDWNFGWKNGRSV